MPKKKNPEDDQRTVEQRSSFGSRDLPAVVPASELTPFVDIEDDEEEHQLDRLKAIDQVAIWDAYRDSGGDPIAAAVATGAPLDIIRMLEVRYDWTTKLAASTMQRNWDRNLDKYEDEPISETRAKSWRTVDLIQKLLDKTAAQLYATRPSHASALEHAKAVSNLANTMERAIKVKHALRGDRFDDQEGSVTAGAGLYQKAMASIMEARGIVIDAIEVAPDEEDDLVLDMDGILNPPAKPEPPRVSQLPPSKKPLRTFDGKPIAPPEEDSSTIEELDRDLEAMGFDVDQVNKNIEKLREQLEAEEAPDPDDPFA